MITKLLKKIPWNNPYVRYFEFVIGLIASCLAIFTFVTGWSKLSDIFISPLPTPNSPPTVLVTTVTPTPPPLLATPTHNLAMSGDCTFLETLLEHSTILEAINDPSGSREPVGLKVIINRPFQLPPGWQVQRVPGTGTGPINLTEGEFVSILAPANCQPLLCPQSVVICEAYNWPRE